MKNLRDEKNKNCWKKKSRVVIKLNMSEKIEILNKTPWFIYGFHNFILFTFSSAMEWSEDQNLALVRGVLTTEPYRFKARTTERGKVEIMGPEKLRKREHENIMGGNWGQEDRQLASFPR